MYNCIRWRCSTCLYVNRLPGLTKCEQCNSPKAGGESLHVLPGDWACGSCACNNFARRRSCYKCGAHKDFRPPTITPVPHTTTPPAPYLSVPAPELSVIDLTEYPDTLCPDTQDDDSLTQLELEDNPLTGEVRVVRDSLPMHRETELKENDVDHDGSSEAKRARYGDSQSTLEPVDFEERDNSPVPKTTSPNVLGLLSTTDAVLAYCCC